MNNQLLLLKNLRENLRDLRAKKTCENHTSDEAVPSSLPKPVTSVKTSVPSVRKKPHVRRGGAIAPTENRWKHQHRPQSPPP